MQSFGTSKPRVRRKAEGTEERTARDLFTYKQPRYPGVLDYGDEDPEPEEPRLDFSVRKVNSSAGFEDELSDISDDELKQVLSAILHNDTDFNVMNENVYVIYQKLVALESLFAEFKRKGCRESFATPTLPPYIQTTTAVYAPGDLQDNSEINEHLNRLALLKVTKGVTYLKVMRSSVPPSEQKFSNDSVINAEIHTRLNRLSVLSHKHDVKFKTFFETLESESSSAGRAGGGF